jgi:hypothetical protein
MVKAEQADGGPSVWADGGGKHQIARGHPGAAGTLRFQFGDPAYKELARTPDLAAIVVVDRAGLIRSIRFLGRPGV